MCAADIPQGGLHVALALGSGFTDDLDMGARGSHMVCGHCVPLMGRAGLMASGHGVFSAAGVQPFRKWADIAQALLEPPEPPFVMSYATAKNQHMAWRSPVSYSRDMFHVRVGLRDLKIRRPVLLQAIRLCQHLGSHPEVETRKQGTTQAKTLPNPFISLSPDLKDVDAGQIKPKVRAILESASAAAGRDAGADDATHEAIRQILNLTQGEVWALRFVLTEDAAQIALTAEAAQATDHVTI